MNRHGGGDAALHGGRPSGTDRWPARLAARRLPTTMLLACGSLASWPIAAPAQALPSGCIPRAALIEILQQDEKQRPVAAGLRSTGQVMEVWATDDRSRWTLVMSWPEARIACVAAQGDAWTPLETPAEGPAL